MNKVSLLDHYLPCISHGFARFLWGLWQCSSYQSQNVRSEEVGSIKSDPLKVVAKTGAAVLFSSGWGRHRQEIWERRRGRHTVTINNIITSSKHISTSSVFLQFQIVNTSNGSPGPCICLSTFNFFVCRLWDKFYGTFQVLVEGKNQDRTRDVQSWQHYCHTS